jgi:hypothetical protein
VHLSCDIPARDLIMYYRFKAKNLNVLKWKYLYLCLIDRIEHEHQSQTTCVQAVSQRLNIIVCLGGFPWKLSSSQVFVSKS